MILAGIAAALAAIGVVQALAGAVFVIRFAAECVSLRRPDRRPALGAIRGITALGAIPGITALGATHGVTVLKPLHGDEPLLEQALATVCAQDHPMFQVVFGVQDERDPALAVVQRLRARFPDCDMTVVVDPARHGANGKVGNLINMLAAARHDLLVIADSDVHAQPDYLTGLIDALDQPGTGLVTTLYTGLPASDRLVQQLGATHITHTFLPGAVLARAMGRQDCLGATMVLHRATLAEIGGFEALVDHLADDQVLGRRVAALGLAVRLAGTVVATTVPEARLRDLLRHELRWARTVRALEPGAYAASVLQYPLFWAALAVLLSGGTIWSIGVFFLAWMGRAAAAVLVDNAVEPLLTTQPKPGDPPAWAARQEVDGSRPFPADLRLEDGGKLADAAPKGVAFPCPVWLLPLRDIISVGVMLASYAGRRVEWRGHHQIADNPGRLPPGPTPSKGLRPR